MVDQIPVQVLEHIFSFLDGRDAVIAQSVCSQWRRLVLECGDWRQMYENLWGLPPTDYVKYCAQLNANSKECSKQMAWKMVFDAKARFIMGYQYKPERYAMYGHDAGVKVAKILPRYNMMLTGSVDRKLFAWDLDSFTRAAVSLPHAGTVRSVAVDDSILATGSTDHRIRIWYAGGEEEEIQEHYDDEEEETDMDVRTENDVDVDMVDVCDGPLLTEEEMECMRGSSTSNFSHGQQQDDPSRRSLPRQFPFDLSGRRVVLADGHNGPVSCLEIKDRALFSGSWDYSVRVWDRDAGSIDDDGYEAEGSIQCTQIVNFDDWVLDMKARGDRLYVAAGPSVYAVDIGGSEAVKMYDITHERLRTGPVTAVDVSQDGNMLMYGNGEGSLFIHDIRSGRGPTRPSFECSSAITDISWEYPWITCALQNGEVVLIHADSSFKQASRRSQPYYSRILVGGCTGGAQCVDIAENRVVAGFEDGTVVTWDFLHAEKAARELQVLRHRKKAARQARKIKDTRPVPKK